MSVNYSDLENQGMKKQNPPNVVKKKNIWKKTWIIIMLVVVMFLVARVINPLGVYVEHMGGFDFTSISIFEDILEEEQHVSFYINDNYRTSIAFVYFAFLKSPPYSMSLTIYDSTNSLDEIIIKTAYIHYDDGEKRNIELNWHKKLEVARVVSGMTSEGNINDPYSRLIYKPYVNIRRARQ